MTNQRLREVTAELNRTTSLDIIGVGFGYKETGGKTIFKGTNPMQGAIRASPHNQL